MIDSYFKTFGALSDLGGKLSFDEQNQAICFGQAIFDEALRVFDCPPQSLQSSDFCL